MGQSGRRVVGQDVGHEMRTESGSPVPSRGLDLAADEKGAALFGLWRTGTWFLRHDGGLVHQDEGVVGDGGRCGRMDFLYAG